MVKLLVFAILLASSPVSGLFEDLLPIEKSCYSGCNLNFAPGTKQSDACKKGCDFIFHNEDCAAQCKSVGTDEEVRACHVGCTISQSGDDKKPVIAIDPISKPEHIKIGPSVLEPERPRSIILIRIRQRPSVEFPSMPMSSMHHLLNGDPMQMFNEMIKQFQDRANNFEQTIRKSFEENSKDIPQLPGFESISELPKNIPLIRIPIINNPDSSSEENNDKAPLTNQFPHMGHFQHRFHHEQMQPMHNRFQQFMSDVRSEWSDLLRKQPKIPIWIFLAIFLSSSAILWYMVMSLCHHTPTRSTLSIRAQELVFHPYDYEGYEKEKIQPDDQPYEVTESLPIKVKLTNI